jgi:hypothetical protein
MSVLEKLRALDEQRAKLLEGAKAEALKKASDAIVELNELGFQYVLNEKSERAQKTPKVPRAAAPQRVRKDSPCPICNFKTDPIHDGRAHRSQNKKAPFTAAELTEKGLTKVA